jgi:hypothetical protein
VRGLFGGPFSLSQKIIIGVLILFFLALFYIMLDANKYAARVRVISGEGRVGVNPTTAALDFGDLSRGTSAIRRVDIQNGTGIPMYIMIFKVGSISDLIDISKNYFVLNPGEQTKIEFSTYIPASAQVEQNYRGRVYLFKIPTFGL